MTLLNLADLIHVLAVIIFGIALVVLIRQKKIEGGLWLQVGAIISITIFTLMIMFQRYF